MGLFQQILGTIAYYAVPPFTTYLHYIRGVQIEEPSSVFIGTNVTIDTVHYDCISVGHNVTISSGSNLIAHSNPPEPIRKEYINKTVDDVAIGDNVYIGTDAIILEGVTIEDWAIVGAGAVVTQDVESYQVVGGNPAEVIGDLRDT
jgi:acetyltransferase-like isoleucine patch superfamily enzyme